MSNVQRKGVYIKYARGWPEGFTNFSKNILFPTEP